MDGRTFSLRKKRSVRPKISAPQQISNPIYEDRPALPSIADEPNPSNSSLPLPPGRERTPSRSPQRPTQSRENTSDYVKRRYSQRITQLPKETEAPPAVPALPGQIPTQPPPRDARRLDPENKSRIPVDVKALQDPALSPEEYVTQILANASEQDIREYQQELSKTRNRTSSDIQHNVYQNRDQFIKISQEAEKLKTEMRMLRNHMSELTNTLGQTNAALGITTDAPSSRKYANRSSVANLEAMWSTHLQELWRRVEGSQKFLPAIPGRHVLHESGRWVELNTATWKPRRRVHLILLNDHLLMASEKKTAGEASPQVNDNSKPKSPPPPTQLVADRCWPLQDVEIVDLGNRSTTGTGPRNNGRPNTANAISVRVGSDSFTYATEGSEKAALLAKYRKAAADLKKLLRIDVDEPAPTPASGRPVSSHGQVGKSNNASADLSATARASMLVEVDGRQQNFRWVETQVDELEINIALQRFDEAVAAVERLRKIAKGNKTNPAVQDLMDGRVQERIEKLAKAITRHLVDTHSWMTSTQQNVAWLIRLGFEARASDAYLEARSNIVHLRASQCTDEGDLHNYIYQLSFIYFTLIRNTVKIYLACFSPAISSACIKWAKEHVELFNTILAQQLQKLEPESDVRKRCLKRVQDNAQVLAEVGVDFRNLVTRGVDAPS